MFEILDNSSRKSDHMLATLASVGYLQGFAPRSAVVNGAAQASRSAAIMQEEPGAGAPGTRDMKGDVITSAHRPPTPPDVHWPNTHLTAPVCALRRRDGIKLRQTLRQAEGGRHRASHGGRGGEHTPGARARSALTLSARTPRACGDGGEGQGVRVARREAVVRERVAAGEREEGEKTLRTVV